MRGGAEDRSDSPLAPVADGNRNVSLTIENTPLAILLPAVQKARE